MNRCVLLNLNPIQLTQDCLHVFIFVFFVALFRVSECPFSLSRIDALHVGTGVRFRNALLLRYGDFTPLMIRFSVSCVLAFGLSLPPPVVPILEHVKALRIKGPITALPWSPFLPRNFDETVVQRQVVSDRVLPALLVIMIERKAVHDELVNAAKCGALLRRVLYSHRNKSYVAVRRFLRRLLSRRGKTQSRNESPALASIHINQGWIGKRESRGGHSKLGHSTVVQAHYYWISLLPPGTLEGREPASRATLTKTARLLPRSVLMSLKCSIIVVRLLFYVDLALENKLSMINIRRVPSPPTLIKISLPKAPALSPRVPSVPANGVPGYSLICL